MKLLLSLDLDLDILELLLEAMLEYRLNLIETFLHLLQGLFLEKDSVVVFFQMPGQVVQVLELLFIKDLVHLGKDWRILLLQNILIDLQLLLTEHKTLMLLVNLVH